ncbi:zf-HC2 domain-containing protein [Paenibacillus sp. PDC88]|uniref:anti-sigma factor n=1 Tax=Paenibacillus sp. PDC88 TaxID=1884375 RepID=UPI0008953283|nr:zf-HC2 domain-containing protein [Paenibacillus sp. PDC88]SDX06690.1 Putative zinc-finger [Paenibacillus sp. PDC88]
MKCQEVVESMHRYIDNDLNDQEKEQLFAHMKTCPSCSEKFQILKALSRDLEAIPDVAPPFSLVDRIMPQLDAIDRAKKEQGSALQEMKKEPELTVLPGRPSIKASKGWMKSYVGRMIMGTAAAAVILGVAVYNYEPQQLNQAEVDSHLMSETEQQSDSTSGSGGVAPKSEEADASLKLKESGTETEAAGTETGEVQSDQADTARAEEVPSPSNSGDNHAQDTETAAPNTDREAAPSKAEDPSSPTPGSDKGSGNGSGGSQSESPSKSTTDHKPAPSSSSAPSAEPSTSGQTGNTQGGDNDAKGQSDTSGQNSAGEQNSTDTGTFSIQSNSSSEMSSASGVSEPPSSRDESEIQSQGFRSLDLPGLVMTISPNWLSPDGKYLVEVTDTKLNVYQLNGDNNEEKKLLQAIELKGTWVKGNWSEDSMTYSYELEFEGKTTQHSYAVPVKSDSSTTAPSSTQNSSTPSSSKNTENAEPKK